MATISIQRGSSFTHTVSGTGKNARQMSTARLNISLDSRSVRNFSPTSSGEGTVTFSGTLSDDNFRLFARCGFCEWKTDGQYVVLVSSKLNVVETVQTGSVSISGTLPCVDCGGDDPPPDTPPDDDGGDDGSYGPVSPWVPLVPSPAVPEDYCLPADFVVAPPTVETPCSDGSGGSGDAGFSSVEVEP